MIFLEAYARPLLVAHTLAAVFLVGASTHQLWWCRGYREGRAGRAAVERRIVAPLAVAFAVTFALGNVLYPTYKVRVRAEYLDAPIAVLADVSARRAEDARLGVVAASRAPDPGAETSASVSGDLSWVGRFFDIKEHWVALGLGASVALWLLARYAHPTQDRRFVVAYLGLSWIVCATAWTGMVIGLVTAAYRAVGGIS